MMSSAAFLGALCLLASFVSVVETASALKEISSRDHFESLIKFNRKPWEGGLPVIIDFYSDGCGPCRMIAPVFKRMAKEFKDKAVFAKVDLNRVNVGQQIRSMPTFQVWWEGKKVEEFSGADEGSIRRFAEQYGAKAKRQNVEVTKEALTTFYAEHDPSKTEDDIDKLLGNKKMKHFELVKSLKKKYGSGPKATPRKKKEKESKDKDSKPKKSTKKGDSNKANLHFATYEELKAEIEKRVEEEAHEEEEDSEDDTEIWFPGNFIGRRSSTNEPEAVVIVGGGPAGLSAAIYAARAGLNPVVIAPAGGGQLLGKGVDVENYPGLMEQTGPGVVQLMRNQALQFGTAFDLRPVTEVNITESPFLITVNDTEYRSHTLIIATGADSKWLGVPGEYDFRGRGVSSCATCDGFLFKDRPAVVVGGGDTAMEDALVLARTSSSVQIIHRRDKFRASKVLSERVLAHDKISVLWNHTVQEFVSKAEMQEGELPTLTHVIAKPSDASSDLTTIECDGAFVAIGHSPNTELFKDQLDMDDTGYLLVEEHSTRTTAPGVFSAGDVADHVYRQAITSAGSGAMAALDAERYLSEIGYVPKDEKEIEAELLAELMADFQDREINNVDSFDTEDIYAQAKGSSEDIYAHARGAKEDL